MSLDLYPAFEFGPDGMTHHTEYDADGELVFEETRPVVDPYDDYREDER